MSELKLENFLPYRLSRAAAVASSQLSEIYRRAYRLTVPEWRTLATLGQFGEMTAKQIGQHSSMHKTKVSRAVASLSQRRWLQRRTDELDRRIEHLTLTPLGLRTYRELAPDMLLYEETLFAELSADERRTLLHGMAILEHALGLENGKRR